MVNDNYFNDEIKVEISASKTKHAELFSAFEYGEVLTFLLHLPDELMADELMADEATIVLQRDDDKRELLFKGEKSANSFRFVLNCGDICAEGLGRGLFYYVFLCGNHVISQNEFGKGYILGTDVNNCSRFQLSVYKNGTNRPTGMEGGIMYQIFPDRFAKGSTATHKEKAVIEEDWFAPISEYPEKPGDPVKNNTFYGGTLWGIIEKLDYLKELGVTLLYLNPVFQSASNHRYDTGDYEKTDELLGGEEALKKLIDAAKEKNIGIILDGVFNHTGADSRYFNLEGTYPSTGAYQSKDSPYYNWYFFNDYPELYECWWGIKILPKVNCQNRDYREFIAGNGGIIEKYFSLGIAGWRLDVADELPDEMLDAIRKKATDCKENALIYGEVWEDASNKIAYSSRRHYFTGGQINAVMNYPLKNALITFLTEGNAEFLFYTMKILYSHYPKAVSDMQMNLLSTHDTERILTVLAGSPDSLKENSVLSHSKLTAEECELGKKRLQIAVLLQMLLPGIPCIYYGDEAGMEGYRDPFNRRPYPWGKEDREVLTFYKEIIALRRSLPMLADAYYRGISCENGVYVFERFNDYGDVLRIVVNMSEQTYFCGKNGKILYSLKCEINNNVLCIKENGVACILSETGKEAFV